ncbi:hypothetical protein JR316_0006771 [Psilocybe cubensis]|uniref:Uncharacterized protein n=2 Tax=Psilocybe cubensis TaxID=181762 RepID=A0A8H7XM49_PSICU|nr:hypothetical protein JR316_0006771 [Psilocybe cubensis]KAH9480173.1 hypothetical protein JR316_0006771 [Psilocybe cubensis]
MASQDRGYTILLSHLHDTSSKLPLSTLQGALAHHLATAWPLPTALAATAISSPFYLSQPFTYDKLQSFSTAFRHGIHLKYRALTEAAKTRSTVSTLLGRSLQTTMSQWVSDVLKGVQGGHPVLRLASCSGLLLGVEDLKVGQKGEKKEGVDIGSARSGVEDETVVSLAEVMDTYAHGFSTSPSSSGIEEWEKEFQPAGQDILSLVLILASQSLPLVARHKLKALPLPILARLLTSTISSAFKAGTFLSSVSASVTLSPNHQVHISPTSPLSQTLQSMSSSPLTKSMASVSRFTAYVLELLIDSPSLSRLSDGLCTISETLDTLQELTKVVERDWIACPLASFTDLDIASDSKAITKSIWMTLKTLLFTTIMLTDSVLSAAIYLSPQSFEVTPASLALQTLHILSHLSFVISEFGGVTTTSQGFEQLKKTFYLALDILAQGDGATGDSGLKAEAYVQQICFTLNSQRAESAATSPRQAKQAFVLASIEQLVPVLSDKCIRDWVWGVCYPHLSDPSHRETYESAHSVILAIFASHAQRQQQYLPGNQSTEPVQLSPKDSGGSLGKQKPMIEQSFAARVLSSVISSDNENKNVGPEADFATSTNQESVLSATFVKRMIPFYASCLIDNSVDGKLSTPQLRLAYSALVRSASVSASTVTSDERPDDSYTLAWYCIQLILDTIHELSPLPKDAKGKGKARSDDNDQNAERLYRLHLVLISTVSSLPLSLILRALDRIRSLILEYPQDDTRDTTTPEGKGKKAELVAALFSELLEKTGDREKEAAMRWWYKHRPMLIAEAKVQEEDGRPGTLLSWFKGLKGNDNGSGVKDTGEREPQSETPILSRL